MKLDAKSSGRAAIHASISATGNHAAAVTSAAGNRTAPWWRARADKPRFGILLDMIGHDNLSIRLSTDTPADLKDKVMAAAKAEGAEKHFGMAMGPITDDHVPLNFAGIPTVDLIGEFGRGGWWHTPADNQKIISAQSLDISIRVTLRLLAGWLEK